MNSLAKKSSSYIPSEIEAIKQDIQKTKETIRVTSDPLMEPILTRLLKEQTQYLSELESKSTNTPIIKKSL